MSVEFTPLQRHASSWDASSCRPTLNCRLKACLVPCAASPEGLRLDAAHVVVLDDFFGEAERESLLHSLTGSEGGSCSSSGPSGSKWERNTADGAHAARTWGLREDALTELTANPTPAILEIQTRLAKLYPECTIAHMPSAQMQDTETVESGADSAHHAEVLAARNGEAEEEASETPDSTQDAIDHQQQPAEHGRLHQANAGSAHGQQRDSGGPGERGDCCSLLANAPVHGDHFEWHVDADPLTLPDSTWRRALGDFCNREPGMPLLVSLLLYLVDDGWEPNMHAETLFLDSLDVGVVVRPKRLRAVLADQDVLHRIVAPSRLAGSRPRYSLVWKLAFLPKRSGQLCSIARPEWGAPTSIGSVARLDTIKRALVAGNKRKRGEQLET